MNHKVKEAFETLQARVSANPGGSESVFTIRTALIEDVTCEARIRDFPPLTIDEPPSMGGTDSGPNPVELVLAALGTCQEIMYASFAAVMGIDLRKVEIQVKGYMDSKGILALDDNTPPGFTEIRFETRIESDADEDRLRRMIEMVEGHCPVLDTLSRPVPIQGKVWHNGLKLKT
ncbi:MAG: OsmC family protein [Proteobacteria bacterium]|nr:OsmC family protein [Pseudomonadota bacterium]